LEGIRLKFKQALAFFALGLLAGSLSINFFQGRKFEELYWEKEKLQVQLYETTAQIHKLKEQQQKFAPATIQEIKLEINTENGFFVEPSFRRNIYELLEELIGEEVQTLSYPLLYNLLQNRIIEDNNKKYRLNVEAVILGETLVYYLSAKKLSVESSSLE
jgi:hypothetical protein